VQVGKNVDEVDNSHTDCNVESLSVSGHFPMLKNLKFSPFERFDFGCHSLYFLFAVRSVRQPASR